jgi:hypothetical protein
MQYIARKLRNHRFPNSPRIAGLSHVSLKCIRTSIDSMLAGEGLWTVHDYLWSDAVLVVSGFRDIGIVMV